MFYKNVRTLTLSKKIKEKEGMIMYKVLGSVEIERNEEIIQKKVSLWKVEYPQLASLVFVNGRVKLGELPAIDIHTVNEFLYNGKYYRYFCEFIQKYCENNGYTQIIGRYDEYVPITEIDSVWAISSQAFITNYMHFIKVQKNEEKKVKVKTSKVLSTAHELWVEDNIAYKKICSELKKLRAEGKTYEDDEVRLLTEDKKFFERENLWVAYNNMMNEAKGSQEVWLSLNPFDKFTSSGTGDATENPTMFNSCWATRICKRRDGNIEVREDGCYSNPEAMYELARLMNSGLIYIPNGKTLTVGGVEFIGYKERGHIWLDEGNAWLEQVYPTKNKQRIKEIVNTISKFIPCDTELSSRDRMGESFSYQDYVGLRSYLETDGGIFLDTVYIDEDGSLCKLPDTRMNMGYDTPDRHPDDGNRYCCEHCGYESHDEDNFYYIEDVGYVCCDCVEERYSRCDGCGELYHNDDIIPVNDGDYHYCEGCVDDYARPCNECGDYHRHRDMTSATDSYGDTVPVCEYCLRRNYTKCSDCGEYIHDDDVSYADNGKAYCETCFDKVCDCEDEAEEVQADSQAQ